MMWTSSSSATVEQVKSEDGYVLADTERDILKIAVVERHLDLVVALFVPDLGVGDPAFTGVSQCRLRCPLEGIAGDRGVGIVR